MAIYTSPNYMFCFNVLKNIFYSQVVKFDDLYGDKEATENFILNLVVFIKKQYNLLCPKEYLSMPVRFEENEDCKAIILELPDARMECDCNYVALRKSKEGKLLFVSSELYVFDRKFMLCAYTENTHYALTPQITSYQDFVDGVLALNGNFS